MIVDRATLTVGAQYINRYELINDFSRSASDDLPPPTGPSNTGFVSSLPAPEPRVSDKRQLFNRVFHAVKLFKRRITCNDRLEKSRESLGSWAVSTMTGYR